MCVSGDFSSGFSSSPAPNLPISPPPSTIVSKKSILDCKADLILKRLDDIEVLLRGILWKYDT